MPRLLHALARARFRPLALFVPLALASGCQLLDLRGNDSAADLPGEVAARVGQPFTLTEGQTAQLDGSDFRLSLVSVPQDSRCPADAMCVWQGEGLVVVGRSHPTMRFAPDTLTTAPRPNLPRTDSLTVGPYLVRIKDLQPYPFASQPRRDPYRATFTLGRARP